MKFVKGRQSSETWSYFAVHLHMPIELGRVNISFKEMKAYMQRISVTLKESALLYNKVFA